MATELPPIDSSDNALIRRQVEEARIAHPARPVVADDQVIGMLVPEALPSEVKQDRSKGGHQNAWLRRIIGMADAPDDGVHDAAVNHDEYLTDAYADTHE